MGSELDGQVTEHRPPPRRAAGPAGPARGRGSARGLHAAPRVRPPFRARHPAGRDRLAQAQRFHALLGDLRSPPPRPAGRSEPQAGSAAPPGPARRQEPPGPHAHGRRSRPVPSQARGASLAQPRSPTPGPPRPHSRPGLTESRRRRACPGSRPREWPGCSRSRCFVSTPEFPSLSFRCGARKRYSVPRPDPSLSLSSRFTHPRHTGPRGAPNNAWVWRTGKKKTHAALSQSRSLPRASRSHQLRQKAEFLPLALWEPPAT